MIPLPLFWLDKMREQFPDFEDWPLLDAFLDEHVKRNMDIVLAREEAYRRASKSARKKFKTFRSAAGGE